MEIKCSCCQVIPEIDIYDNIQGIKFICKDKNNNNNIKHYGIFSINNFYKYFVQQNNNSNKALNTFIKQIETNYNNNISSIINYIEFTKKFDDLIIKLNKTYNNFKEYFYKILFIKAQIKKEKENEKNNNYYSFNNIIEKFEEMINYINNSMLIKEKFPKILSNDEINIKLDEILKLEGNKSKINIDLYKKDFEYKNSKKNNICLKKLFKFENDENYVGSFIKLNEALSPAYFIYSYQIRNALKQYSTFFQIYTKNLNLLMNQFICPEKILQILPLKNNNILLKLKSKAIIIELDLDKKKIEIIQEIISESKLFVESLINFNSTEISLLLQTNSNKCLYKNNHEKKYILQQDNFTTKIKGEELLFIDQNNFITLFRRDIRLYEIVKVNLDKKNKLDLIKRKKISTNFSFLSGIQFIGENKQYVIIGSSLHLFLLSCKYKEIVSIFSYYRMEIMHKGINDEVYICLSDWIKGHKILRQININNEGDLIVEGNNYFEKFDFYNKHGLIDLGDTICYIEDNNKE